MAFCNTEIVGRAIAGERRSLARAISLVESEENLLRDALPAASVRRRAGPGAPHVIGVTGAPGVGKSTLVDRLIEQSRQGNRRVAVVAVDPSSPFTGGALLGDRVRMERHAGDDGVFIRSLASRGFSGGLSAATADVVDLLDACGFDDVIVETVGVGQAELGVLQVADTIVAVFVPESGDSLQTMKAGLLEAADLVVVNKADRPGAERLVQEFQTTLTVPVLLTSALEGRGVPELYAAIRAHLTWLCGNGRSTFERRRKNAHIAERRGGSMNLADAKRILEDLAALAPPRPGSLELFFDGPIARIILDNPAAGNAMTLRMMAELAAIVDRLSAWDGAIVTVEARGTGAFCAGGHLEEVRDFLGASEHGEPMSRAMTSVLKALRDLPAVSVSVLEGPAIGGGAELAVSTDFRIAATKASIRFAQAALGVAPGWGGAARLTALVGRRTALRLLTTAEPVLATEAARMGLVDRVEADGKVALEQFCAPILAIPTAATRAVKAQIVAAEQGRREEESRIFASVWGGPDHERAVERWSRRS